MIPNKNLELEDKLGEIRRAAQERIAKREASQGNQGYIDLKKIGIATDALKQIDEATARRLNIAAFQMSGRTLFIAALDPTTPGVNQLLDDFLKKGIQTKTFLASEGSLQHAWESYRFVAKEKASISERINIEEGKVAELEKTLSSLKDVAGAIGKATRSKTSAQEVLEVILAGALHNHASDVHLEPSTNGVTLRYRIDGALHDVGQINLELYHLLLSRIKLLASLRLNITTASQDGRFSFGIGGTVIELRVSVIPSEFGETIVTRILDPRIIALDIAELGMRADDLAIAEKELKAPNGMILNTGPTGSGKTTTLYAFLKRVATKEIKVITIEDPIEYHVEGIEQTQVEAKTGYTFENGLQAIMRQDPDVILVGEIRDPETAGIALQAALTGHLVFSTLHTNSASGVIPRLIDLRAPITSIGPALNLIIAQRLVRRLCPACKKKVPLTPELQEKVKQFFIHLPPRADRSRVKEVALYEPSEEAGGGCSQCHGGYKGRIGIFELLKIGEEIEELIERQAGEGALARFAKKQGMVTLQQDGILKALSGITSLKEVEAITGPLQF